MKKIISICLFCAISQLLLAQISVFAPTKSYYQIKKSLTQVSSDVQFTQQLKALQLNQKQPTNFSLNTHQKLPVPSAYAYKDLAFFCKIEVQLEKSVKLPVKFRLGSVDYVDYLEGKRRDY